MTTLGCIKAKMGKTEYFIAKLPAGELINSVGIAKELPEWPNLTAEEKMQREYDIKRIIDDIVPYVIEDPDRFFSSLIIDIYAGYDEIIFEPITNVVKNIPVAYSVPMNDMGFITLPGTERLIALDGQHRLLSLKIAIRGEMGLPAGTKLSSTSKKLVPHPELAKEELSVILVKHTDTAKIRKIFNKINKYAKQTSRSDNIITSDDDTFAVLVRRLIDSNGPLVKINDIDLVNWKSNTLSTRSKNLTTLSALYTMAQTILKDNNLSTHKLPNDIELEAAYQTLASFWSYTLKEILVFQKYIELTKHNKPVSQLRENNILMKPVTQMALAHVALMAERKGIKWSTIVAKLNEIDWSFENNLWFNILVIGSVNKKMITGKEAIRGAGMVISYMLLGNKMTPSEIADVKQVFTNAKNDTSLSLPAIIK